MSFSLRGFSFPKERKERTESQIIITIKTCRFDNFSRKIYDVKFQGLLNIFSGIYEFFKHPTQPGKPIFYYHFSQTFHCMLQL